MSNTTLIVMAACTFMILPELMNYVRRKAIEIEKENDEQ